ncbi:MAG: hypothetical protein M9890_12835 [Thermomicrobiales bacterium]|nr:hypothetical protein [Thermomicrobiales bacterium]
MQQRGVAPLGSGRAERPEVVVLPTHADSSPRGNALLHLALQLAPDVLRTLERSRARNNVRQVTPKIVEPRNIVHGLNMSEVELDVRIPLVRNITVRRATAWAADLPAITPAAPRRSGRLRRVGIVGVGACVAATIGILANRASGLVAPVIRRG